MITEAQALGALLVAVFIGCVAILVIGQVHGSRHHRKLMAELNAMVHGEARFSTPRLCKEIVS